MNKREQGEHNRVQMMRVLARMGYGTTRQVARATWMRCTPSTRRMAGRTLRWLAENGLIVSRRDGDSINNEQLTAITAKGAAWLAARHESLPDGKPHARDWLRHAHPHRTACNSVYAALLEVDVDDAVWTELEIRSGQAPLPSFKFTTTDKAGKTELHEKIPDLLREVSDGLYEWIEVENGWRGERDLNKVCNCMRAMFKTPRQTPCQVARMHFIVTSPGAKTIGRRVRAKLTHDADSGYSAPVRELDARILRDHVRVSVLDPETLELQPLPH